MQITIRTIKREELPPNTKVGKFNTEKLASLFNLPPAALAFIKVMKPTIEMSLDLQPWVSSTGYFDLQ
jgi:hypothetical protein